VTGVAGGSNSAAKTVIESCFEKMLAEICVAASNNQAISQSRKALMGKRA